jgi:hypothetical protein
VGASLGRAKSRPAAQGLHQVHAENPRRHRPAVQAGQREGGEQPEEGAQALVAPGVEQPDGEQQRRQEHVAASDDGVLVGEEEGERHQQVERPGQWRPAQEEPGAADRDRGADAVDGAVGHVQLREGRQ